MDKKDRLSNLFKLKSQNEHLRKENFELEEEFTKSKLEYEAIIKNSEDDVEEVIKKEESILKDLQEKNSIVSTEVCYLFLKISFSWV